MNIVRLENIEDKLITVQGEKILLDSDAAEIYGVETKRINEAVKNNPDKFPIGYILDLSDESWESLRSKISTLNGTEHGAHDHKALRQLIIAMSVWCLMMDLRRRRSI